MVALESLEKEQNDLLKTLVDAYHRLPRSQRQDFKYELALIRKGAISRSKCEEITRKGESILFSQGEPKVVTREEDLPRNLDAELIYHPGLPEGVLKTLQSDIDSLTQHKFIEFRDAEHFFITIDGLSMSGDTERNSMIENSYTQNTRSVFVVHGRNMIARNAMFDFLRSLDLKPIEWEAAVSMTGKTSPYIGEILDAAFNHAQAVVVLLTPDDEARLKPSFWGDKEPAHETNLTGQARSNVIFEAGMAIGRNADRTIIVQIGEDLRSFSDIAGRHYVHIRGSHADRQKLIGRLRSAGCAVDDSNTAWLSAGDFEAAFKKTLEVKQSVPQGETEPFTSNGRSIGAPSALWKTIIGSQEVRPGVFLVDGIGEVFASPMENGIIEQLGGNPECILADRTTASSYIPQYVITKYIPRTEPQWHIG